MAIQLISSGKRRHIFAIFSEIISYINPFSGASSNANGSVGLVPQPMIADRNKFLRGDGTWQSVSSGGTGGIDSSEVQNMIDNSLANYLPLTGGNLSNDLTINNDSVVTASELSTALSDYLPLAGGNITGSLTVQTKDVMTIDSTGSSTTGTYIRFTNGLQICYGSVSVTTSNPSFTFPAAFNATPSVTTGLNMTATRATSIQLITVTSTNFSASIYSNSHVSGTCLYMAMGTWK